MFQIKKCRLCDAKEETINLMISECCKVAQKEYKARWRKWIPEKYPRKMNVNPIAKCYIHNQEFVLVNKMLKNLLFQDRNESPKLDQKNRPSDK